MSVERNVPWPFPGVGTEPLTLLQEVLAQSCPRPASSPPSKTQILGTTRGTAPHQEFGSSHPVLQGSVAWMKPVACQLASGPENRAGHS